jgi:hypothetical protein
MKPKVTGKKPGSRRQLKRVASKLQAKPPKIREPRKVIVSFRLRTSEAELLRKDLNQRPIAGVKSVKQFARKLTIDYARGRTVYVNDVDRSIDPDARERLTLEAPNIDMEDTEFLAKLRDFIQVGDNWAKLRLLFLGVGWPSDMAAQYAAAMTPGDRLAWGKTAVSAVLKQLILK